MIFWAQYLKLTRMEDCYEFYQEDSYDIPTFLSINSIMKRKMYLEQILYMYNRGGL